MEADLLKKIRNWPGQAWKVEDMIAPTFADLVKSYQDSDGDFSAYQIRKLLLADGESRKVFRKKGEGVLGRLLPEIEPIAEAAVQIQEAQDALEETARRMFRNAGELGNELLLDMRKIVFGHKLASPMEAEQAALRKRLLCYLIGVSFALAFLLCCISIAFF